MSCTNGCCSDPEMAEMRHRLNPVNPRGEDEVYERGRDEEVLRAFVKQQKRLPPDMEKLLHDNAWELNID